MGMPNISALDSSQDETELGKTGMIMYIFICLRKKYMIYQLIRTTLDTIY